jgi:hypothetical protein
MNKSFSSYKELVEEKQKLEVLIHAQKELIRADVKALKVQLKPVTDLVDNVKKFTSRDSSNLLLNIGSDIAVNTLIKNLLLAKAGWLTRLVVPYLMKNFSSNFLAEQKDKWWDKLTSWLGHKNGKEKEKEKEKESEEDVF